MTKETPTIGALEIMHKKIIILILIALSSAIFISLKAYNRKAYISDTPVVQQQENTQAYIDFTKETFSRYSLGNTEGISEGALEGLGDSITGLNSFPKEYFSTSFTVLHTKDGLAGGKEMNIVFEANPDKVFWVWVYRLAGGGYELRGFQENTYYNNKK